MQKTKKNLFDLLIGFVKYGKTTIEYTLFMSSVKKLNMMIFYHLKWLKGKCQRKVSNVKDKPYHRYV